MPPANATRTLRPRNNTCSLGAGDEALAMCASVSYLRGTRPGRAVTPQLLPRQPGLSRHEMVSDTQTDMLLGEPKSAICVQRFDDSLNSAIHTTYRSWLRSSSMREPRDPPLKVVSLFLFHSCIGRSTVCILSLLRLTAFFGKQTSGGAGRMPNQRQTTI